MPAKHPAGADWATLHRRLAQLGAAGVQLDAVAGGGWSVSFSLNSPRNDKAVRIQAQAGSPEAALELALARADRSLAEQGQ